MNDLSNSPTTDPTAPGSAGAACSLPDKPGCADCRGEKPVLTEEQRDLELESLPSCWEYDPKRRTIYALFAFPDFRTSKAFVNAVSDVAEQMSYHPDISFGWGFVRIDIQTHSVGDVTEKSFELARNIHKDPVVKVLHKLTVEGKRF